MSSAANEHQAPPKLFKYVSIERARAILETREIRMTQPRYLNDPHELNLIVNAEGLQEDFYQSCIKKGETPERAAEIATNNIVDLVIEHVTHISTARDQIGVLSLSEVHDNMLLWAHYGDEHRGATIELDISRLATLGRSSRELECLAQVQYVDTRIDFTAARIPLWMTLAFKSRPWAHEMEWRLLRSLPTLRRKTEEVFVIDLPPEAVRRVIFGAHADAAQEEPIVDLLRSQKDFGHVAVEKAMFRTNLIGLETIPISKFGWTILHGEHHFGDRWREIAKWVDMRSLESAEKGGRIRANPTD